VAWVGDGKNTKKKFNQSTTGGVGAMEFLKYFYTKQLLYLYGTTLSIEAEVWPGV
jgi:hypothetical protein